MSHRNHGNHRNSFRLRRKGGGHTESTESTESGAGAGRFRPTLRVSWNGVRRVSHVSARIWAQEFCGILREQRAICEGGGHRILMKQKDDKILRIICKY